MEMLLNIHFPNNYIISFNCVLKSLLHHHQVPVSSYIIKESLKLKSSDAETVCSVEMLPTA
jgi:lipopolysaccharide biosynthesis glycosyltransferase